MPALRAASQRLLMAELSLLSRGPNTTRSGRCIAEFDRRKAGIAKVRAACPQPAFEGKLVVTWKAAQATDQVD